MRRLLRRLWRLRFRWHALWLAGPALLRQLAQQNPEALRAGRRQRRRNDGSAARRGIMGLAATGLQFFQDSIFAHLPRGLRQLVTLCFQALIVVADRLPSDTSREHNALVFIAVARKPT